MDSIEIDWKSLVVSGNSIREIFKPVDAEYAPLPDISAYELSKILPFLLGQVLMEKDWEELGAAQRHLKRKN
jgi:hypothetical protein